ncbi:MAG: Holliday junction branch migration protein RuvA [Oscillospiraceae bacterium]|nr:Holliday junction branch migration protein RuvA [Oscillospiraceae bacterium]
MIYAIQGILEHTEPYLAVVNTGGVSYACHTSLTTLSALKKGQKVRLMTHMHIREGICDLYGFAGKEELSAFCMLIGISGVGPKAAIAILSSSSPERLALAVISGDEKALTVAPGIGKKIAQRIILELKDKLSKEQAQSSSSSQILPVIPGGQGKLAEAQAALGVLGYTPIEAATVLKGLDTEALSVEEIVHHCLRAFGSKG